MKRLLQIWQTLAIYIIWPMLTFLIISPLTILSLLLKIYPLAGLILNTWSKWSCLIVGKSYLIESTQHIDLNKRYIIIANHSSMFDIPLSSILFRTPVSWVMKESLLKIPIFNTLFSLGVGIPIPRANARKSLAKMIESTHKIKEKINPNIIIYPEGTRTKTGEINSFKRGFVQLMRTYEMDILPITLNGVFDFFSVKHRIPNPDSQFKITVHPVQRYQDLKDFDDKQIVQKMYDIISKDYDIK